jgi:NTE family protein
MSGRSIAMPVLAVLLFLPPAYPRGAERLPKIGLVLSGGGARGVAHVGVLRWFEEHRVPVHCIAGTSMGGLVGGFYAMGFDPMEILDILRALDWKEVTGSGPGYPDLAFRRKEDRREYQVDLEIGLKHGLSLPPGLVSPHFIGLFLDRMTLPYWSLRSFDELPIPFRCMATDFLKAQPVVLRDGPLGSALRATMSIPGVFPPARRDGRILVDGGLLNNIPTNVMRSEMAPDVVIAVDTGTRLGDIKRIASLGGVLDQSIVVMTIESDRRNLALADIVISPDLGDISTLDFSSIPTAVDIGYRATADRAVVLDKFALDEEGWRQYLAQRSARRRTVVPNVANVTVSGVPEPAEREITKHFERFRGNPIATPPLEKALTHLVGEGRYESIGYTLVPAAGPAGAPDLRLIFKEKTYAPPTLNPGIDIELSDVSDIHFTIGNRLTLYDVGKWGSEWRNDVRLGFNTRIASEYYLPVSSWSGLFVAPRVSWDRGSQNVFRGDQRAAEYQGDRLGGGFDIGRSGRLHEFRAGYAVNHFSARVRTGESLLPAVDGLESYGRARYTFDSTDSAGIPARGLRLSAEDRWYAAAPGAERAFQQLEVRGWGFVPVSSRGTVIVAASLGTSFDSTAPPGQQFTLGGPFRLGAFDRERYRGSNYGLVQLGYLHRVSQLPPFLGGKIDLVLWGDAGDTFESFGDAKPHGVLSTGIMMETKLGPVSLTGSWGDGGSGKVWFTLGRIF